jgi:uncharacterized protein
MKLKSKKEQEFFELMVAQAEAAVEAAGEFLKFADDFSQMRGCLERLEAIEHRADEKCHQLINKINTQFITPLDKEDMHALADRLDDITDTIEKAASRIDTYRIQVPRKELRELVAGLSDIVNEAHVLISLLGGGLNSDKLPPVIERIHTSETNMDKKFRKALTALFEDESVDARNLIKWKEVYETIEKATNRTEKLASFVESLMIKYK